MAFGIKTHLKGWVSTLILFFFRNIFKKILNKFVFYLSTTYICDMEMISKIDSFLKSTQKISESMATISKITAKLNAQSVMMEKIIKQSKLAVNVASMPKFYGGGEAIPLPPFSEVNIDNRIFYGGGLPQSLPSRVVPILPLANSQYREIPLEFRNKPNLEFLKKSISELYPTTCVEVKITPSKQDSFFSPISSQATQLSNIKTVQSVAENELNRHFKVRAKIENKISDALSLLESSERNNFADESIWWDTPLYGSFVTNTKIGKPICIEDILSQDIEDFFIHHIEELKMHDEKIIHQLSVIKLLNNLYESLVWALKKICINKREFFRKINSFHFKNLDDYHSLTLVDN